MKRSIIYLTLLVIAVLFSVPAVDARQVVKSKNLSAHVSDSFQCADQISLTIHAPNSAYFKKGSMELQRLVGSARSILGFECSTIKKINIAGKVNNQVVYRGRSFASEKWMVIGSGQQLAQPKKQVIPATAKSIPKQSVSHQGQKLFVKGPNGFRNISLNTWNGLPRLGMADRRGLPRRAPWSDRRFSEKNKSLIEVARSLEQHQYSFGLLTVLDYMRFHRDCFSNLDTYEAKTEQCSGTVINHSDQVKPWLYNINAMALALTPQAYGKFFCPGEGGKPFCRTVMPDQLERKGDRGQRVRYDEFEKRDWFAGLMNAYGKEFKAMWQKSRLPEEIWHVRPVMLREYDFEKQQYDFYFDPGGMTFFDTSIPRPPHSPEESGPFYIGNLGILPRYQPTADFETQNRNYRRIHVPLPMNPQQARKIGNLNKNRRFYAVVKFRLLPHKGMSQQGPIKGQTELRFHLAENRIRLYQDLALTQKIADRPIFENAKTAGKQIQAPGAGKPDKDDRVIDGETLAVMRIKKGALLDGSLQQIADSIVKDERSFWSDHYYRVQNLNQVSHLSGQQKKKAEDLAKLGHISWQQMNENQKKDFFQYMRGQGGVPGTWPQSFPSVNWGLNLVTVFPKGHLSTDRAVSNVPATSQEKAIVAQFLKEMTRDYPTEKLILSHDMGNVQYDNQKQQLQYHWPFRLLSRVDFDDEPGRQYPGESNHRLVSSKSKDRAIYPGRAFEGYDRSRYPQRCMTNPKTKATNCAAQMSAIIDNSRKTTFFALDRVLPAPELKMAPDRGARLVNGVPGKKWQLIVELEKARMESSPFSYMERGKQNLQQSETQTIFASVKKASIRAPSGEIIWSVAGSQLKKPAKGSQLLAEGSKRFKWPESVILANKIPNGALVAFLFVKHYPDRVDQRFLEAMFSSRWQYEKDEANPVGGRFFHQGARQPTWTDLQNALPEFHKWMTQRAKALPDRVQLQIPIRYVRDNVQPYSSQVSWNKAPDSPSRYGAERDADQRVRKCKSKEERDRSKYERCENLRKDLQEEQRSLAKAEKAGCPGPEGMEKEVEIEATGACDFSTVPMSQLQAAAMACMEERCGPMPTTQEGAAEYQKCSQAVIQAMSAQMASAHGSRSAKRRQAEASGDECELCRQKISKIERDLKRKKCDNYLSPPESRNCESLGEVEKVTHMYVDLLRIKGMGSSAVLLPNRTSYSDTNLYLEIAVGRLKVPYDPPGAGANPSTAMLDLELNISSGKSTNQKNTMLLEAAVKKSKIRLAASEL